MTLKIENLKVEIEGKEILKGISLEVKKGEIVALMGPNGSGKTSLAFAAMGHPDYKITNGKIIVNNQDVTVLSPDKRAKAGLFLSFQHPAEIPGVSVTSFLRAALKSAKGKDVNVLEFYRYLKEKMKTLNINEEFAKRSLNEGFSGGEKKKMEMLQLSVLEPDFAILDESDSGLDSSALKLVSEAINNVVKEKKTGILLITHYLKFFKYLNPNKVLVMKEGKIVDQGGHELAEEIEKNGYKKYN